MASSSHPDRIRYSLELMTSLLNRFEPHGFSATMVNSGKPAPDLFLHAAREMGVRPADCILIEDSPAGIAAVRAAGMSVFAFAGGSHARFPAFREKIARLDFTRCLIWFNLSAVISGKAIWASRQTVVCDNR